MIESPRSVDNVYLMKRQLCSVCHEQVQVSRLYRCNMGGHIICTSCFNKMPKNRGARCMHCNSVFIKVRAGPEEHHKRSVTVEDLFQLPKEQVNLLLSKTCREKLDSADDEVKNDELTHIVKKNQQTANNMQIYKPFKCPHLPCGKTVNSSSLKAHYVYEHADIATYLVKRGEELHIASNVAVIEHGMTYCLAMIEVVDEYRVVSRADGFYKKLNQKVPAAVFWLLVSGSAEMGRTKAHALYWLVTDSDLPFKCTLEMSSSADTCSCATFCGVNDIREDITVAAIAKRMNCLYLSYGSLLHLKGQWGEVNLRITIH